MRTACGRTRSRSSLTFPAPRSPCICARRARPASSTSRPRPSFSPTTCWRASSRTRSKLDAVWIAPDERLRRRSRRRRAGAGGERLSRTGQEGRPHRRRLGPDRLYDRRHHVLCRPAGRHRGAALRQSRRALFLPPRPMHHGDRAAAQRQGAQFLRAAGADDGRAGARRCAPSRSSASSSPASPTAIWRSIRSARSTPTAMSSNAAR